MHVAGHLDALFVTSNYKKDRQRQYGPFDANFTAREDTRAIINDSQGRHIFSVE